MMKFELRKIRERAGLTQAQLADKSGVPQTTISGAEHGTRSPNVITARKLADALGVDINDLLVREKEASK